MRAPTKRSPELVPIDPSSLRGCKPERCSLLLPANLTEDDWQVVGETLGSFETSASWWIGDWWAHGEARYGQRTAIVQDEGWQGPSLQRCKNCAYVARRFKRSRRRDLLSFTHHEEVAALNEVDADALLDWAEEILATGRRCSVRELRAEGWIRHHDAVAAATEPVITVSVTEPTAQNSWVPMPTQLVPQIAPVEAQSAEHSVHWLRPPDGVDDKVVAMGMEFVERITPTMQVSHALRLRLLTELRPVRPDGSCVPR
jgi:hypothetical protein